MSLGSRERRSNNPDAPGRGNAQHGTALLILGAAGFVLLWNSGFIGAEYVLPNVGPLTLLFWRYWCLCLILAVYLGLRGRLRWPGKRLVAHASILGILAHGTWLGCVIYALQLGVPAGLVALIVALQPLLTGALSGLITGDLTSRSQWLGSLIGFGGVFITIGARIDLGQPTNLFAYMLPFGSVVAITLASLFERRRVKRREAGRMSLDLSLFYQALGTALVVSLPAVLFEGLAIQVDGPFILTMLWLVLGVSAGAYGLMWFLIEHLDANRVATLFYLGPPVTMLMAWAAFGDKVTVWGLLGFCAVAIGVGISHLPDVKGNRGH